MLSLREYREPSSRLPDRLPWACLVAPGVVLQKDAIFQRTLAFRGPDLASSLDSELIAASARLNNALEVNVQESAEKDGDARDRQSKDDAGERVLRRREVTPPEYQSEQ